MPFIVFEMLPCRHALADEHGFIVQDGTFYAYLGESTEVKVPEDVRKVASGAFAENRKYRRLFLPESVTEIGEGAFRGCGDLFELRILSGKVRTLGEDPFGGCRRLVTVTVPGMTTADFADVQEQTAAALGFCEKSTLYTPETAAAYRKYLEAEQERILKTAVNESLTDAVRYFTEQDMLSDTGYFEILEYAQNRKAMEIVAVLLDHRKKREDLDEFSRYDI